MERISTLATRWLTQKIAARRPDGTARYCPTTLDRYANEVNRHIIPYLGHVQVTSLTKRDVLRWRDELASVLKTKTVNACHRTLRNILRSESTEDVAKCASLVPTLLEDDARTTDDDPNLLTLPELRAVLAAFRVRFPQHYPLAFTLATTAMRISTALVLKWDDLDCERWVIHARKRRSKKLVLPGVKRGRLSKDTPPLLPELWAVIMAARQTFNEAQKNSGLVFPSEAGGYRSRSVLDDSMKVCLKEAGLGHRRVTPSTGFRRTAVVLYRQAADSAISQQIAGHTTVAMHNHYGPAQDAEKQQAAVSAFAGILKKEET